MDEERQVTPWVVCVGIALVVGGLGRRSIAETPWIDLGEEGQTLYVSARLRNGPAPGQGRVLALATAGGAVRVGAGVNEAGRYWLWLYDHAVSGDVHEPGSDVLLLLKVVSHRRQNDRVYLNVLPAGEGLPECEPAQWMLTNAGGRSDADLARVLVEPPDAGDTLGGIRVARTWDGLRGAGEIEATRAAPSVHQSLDLSPPHPVTNPSSGLMLDLPGTGTDPTRIDFSSLLRVPAEHTIISDVRDQGGKRVHQHAYLAFYAGRYWAMWSDGPGLPRPNLTPEQHRNVVPGHDRPGNRVSYAISRDGLAWSEPMDMTGPTENNGVRIARGLWVREGELLALTSYWTGPGWRGLRLEAYRWDGGKGRWGFHGLVQDDALNNFPPKRLATGEFMMTRRDWRHRVSVMIGGTEAFDEWRIRPVDNADATMKPEEPYWYVLPDGENLVGLIRDNARSGRLLRVFSTDGGQTWSRIVKTNFPDATSKFFVLRTSRGYYAMVSNANPRRRDPLTLSISRDGLVYRHMFYLVGGRHVDYPHMIEQDGDLLIAFSGAKQTMEVLKVSLDDVDRLIAKESRND